jgi:hypothetical protein
MFRRDISLPSSGSKNKMSKKPLEAGDESSENLFASAGA